MPDILNTIFSRRSIRAYQDKEVPRETLVALLKAAMAAPSAVNKQPWEFVALSTMDSLRRLQAELPFGQHNATAAILVCGVPERAQSTPDGSFWVQDCSAAIENILIAAAGLGLGAVWCGIYPGEERIAAVKRVVGIPEDVIPLGLILVGYPAEEKPARTQYREDRVHWEKW